MVDQPLPAARRSRGSWRAAAFLVRADAAVRDVSLRLAVRDASPRVRVIDASLRVRVRVSYARRAAF